MEGSRPGAFPVENPESHEQRGPREVHLREAQVLPLPGDGARGEGFGAGGNRPADMPQQREYQGAAHAVLQEVVGDFAEEFD